MNNHNLLLEYLDKVRYNNLLKDHFVDLEAISLIHPHILLGVVDSATSKESLTKYLESLILDTRDHTRSGFHPVVMYALMSLYTLHRPTPALHSHEYIPKTLDGSRQ